MMNRLLVTICAATGACLLWSGCTGYQLGSVKPSIFSGVDRVHIPPFKNDTLEPRLSSLVTNAVLKELQADGTYQIANRASCDAILEGRIVTIRKNQLRAVRTDTLRSRELRMQLIVDWQLVDPQSGRPIRDLRMEANREQKDKGTREDIYQVSRGRIIGETIQFVDPSLQVAERNSLAVAAEDVAEKLVARLANGW